MRKFDWLNGTDNNWLVPAAPAISTCEDQKYNDGNNDRDYMLNSMCSL